MSDPCASSAPFRLLYVEDSHSDVALVREALKGFEPTVELTAIERGEQALSYLHQEPPYVDVRQPHLLLLDLNLPGMNGEQVLIAVRNDPKLKAVPVVIFTSAASEVLCKPVYQENANSCVRKAQDLDSFLDTIQQTCRYWFSVASLPSPD